jgi:UPF0755 protein
MAVAVAVALVAAAAVAGWRAWRSLDAPLPIAGPVRYKIPPGSSLQHIALELGRLQLLAQPRTWVLYARLSGVGAAVKAGEYEAEPGMTPRVLLAHMVKGEVVLHAFTIIDGWRVDDVLAALRRDPDIVTTLPEDASQLMDKLGFPGTAAEGRFLPETYLFPSGATDVAILQQAHAALERVLGAAWSGRDTTQPLKSPDELLIVASIVEKESGLPAELPKIAGLYLHRIALGMRLQADPTVIYGLGGRYDGTLHAVDLRTDGPYNTYTRSGLPPTPIALPSAAAIRATARPLASDAIYFVASGAGDGSHVFSATLAEQNAAVARYLARLRERAVPEARPR